MPDPQGVFPLDEYPIHQVPAPIEWVRSDRNFYDRSYWSLLDRAGEVMAISGIGYYPNLETKDAYLLIRRGNHQTALHFADRIDSDRLNQHCGAYRLEVLNALHRSRIVVDEYEGISADLTWQGSFPAAPEQRHVMRAAVHRTTLDAQRFCQVGTWQGQLTIDGTRYEVTPDRFIGSRDRSWGVRPVGESIPAGRPDEPAFDGMWWLYATIAFEQFAMVVIIQEDPDGYRILNDCKRIWPDGRMEQLGWPRVVTRYEPGTRLPRSSTVYAQLPDGSPIQVDVESRLSLATHVGGGYGGDPDWAHGTWRGEKWAERVSYDLADDAVRSRLPFGLIDNVGRALWTQDGAPEQEGWGLYEHGVIGIHRPSGFLDWFSPAP